MSFQIQDPRIRSFQTGLASEKRLVLDGTRRYRSLTSSHQDKKARQLNRYRFYTPREIGRSNFSQKISRMLFHYTTIKQN